MSRQASKAFLAALRLGEADARKMSKGRKAKLYKPGSGLKQKPAPASAVAEVIKSPVREAVNRVRLTASRFLAHRASLADLDEAIRILTATRATRDW